MNTSCIRKAPGHLRGGGGVVHPLHPPPRSIPGLSNSTIILNLTCLLSNSISSHGVRVLYYIKEYCPIKDSSNMTISDWIEIALDIKDNYNSCDGFVVIHGTDTMAYSVSALSFMLESLGKSVVFTGSQV